MAFSLCFVPGGLSMFLLSGFEPGDRLCYGTYLFPSSTSTFPFSITLFALLYTKRKYLMKFIIFLDKEYTLELHGSCSWHLKVLTWLALPSCRFDKIIKKEIPANIVYEDEQVLNYLHALNFSWPHSTSLSHSNTIYLCAFCFLSCMVKNNSQKQSSSLKMISRLMWLLSE